MVSAGPKQKKAETWIDASVKAKTELQAKLKKSGMPIVSTWMKHKAKAEPFVVDLKGVDKQMCIRDSGNSSGSGRCTPSGCTSPGRYS